MIYNLINKSKCLQFKTKWCFPDSVSPPPETLSAPRNLMYTSDLKPSYDDLAHIFDSDDSDRDDNVHVSMVFNLKYLSIILHCYLASMSRGSVSLY